MSIQLNTILIYFLIIITEGLRNINKKIKYYVV